MLWENGIGVQVKHTEILTEDDETKKVVFRLLHHYKMLPFSELERCSAAWSGGTTVFQSFTAKVEIQFRSVHLL